MKQKRPTIFQKQKGRHRHSGYWIALTLAIIVCALCVFIFFALSLEIEPQAPFLLCIFKSGVRTPCTHTSLGLGRFPKPIAKLPANCCSKWIHVSWTVTIATTIMTKNLHLCAKFAKMCTQHSLSDQRGERIYMLSMAWKWIEQQNTWHKHLST